MRKDMFKVIVERPRLGGYTRKGRMQDFDAVPKQQGMRRRHKIGGNWKMLNENLAPLRRYLMKQAGRPWNKIYSEVCACLHTRHTVQQHVRDHIQDFVELHPCVRSMTVYVWSPDRKFRKEKRERLWHQPLYVDPRDGILKLIRKHPLVKARERKKGE